MRKIIFILFSLISCNVSPLETKLTELDNVLADREKYASDYIAGIDILKNTLSYCDSDSTRWENEYKIFDLYRFFQIDSASRYLELMETHANNGHQVLETSLANVKVLIAGSKYSEAEYILSNIVENRLTDKEKADYYNSLLLLYAFKINDGTLSETEHKRYIKKRYEARKHYISCEGIDDFEKIRRPAIQMYEDGEILEAIPILENLFRIAPKESKAHAAYSLAKAYEAKGDYVMTKYWFAQGAISNLKFPSGEFQSLYELSLILFDEHRMTRAVEYSRAALEESLNCNYTARINNSAKSQLSIVKAAHYREARSRKAREIAIVSLIGLCLVIVYFWQRTLKQSKKIEESSNIIREMNGLLEEAGKIKEGYVQRYIALSASYLSLVKEYRHDLRVTLREHGMEEVMRKLRQPDSEVLKMDNKQFYAIFDEAFLGIYPDFIKKVNMMLKEEARFKLSPGDELPTNLRILALIRLGITDSGKIAQILNCAPTSVYTYRSKIKKFALCSPEEFESTLQ